MILIENKMPKHGSDAGCWFRCCNFVSFIFILSPNSSLSIFSGCNWPADTSSTVSIASSIETVVTSKDFNWLNRKEKEKEKKIIYFFSAVNVSSIFFQHYLYFPSQCPFHSVSIQCFPNCYVDMWV